MPNATATPNKRVLEAAAQGGGERTLEARDYNFSEESA